MTYDEIFTARDRLILNEIKERAEERASGYRALRTLLWMAKSYPKCTLRKELNKVWLNPRGVNLRKLQVVMEVILGEDLCW